MVTLRPQQLSFLSSPHVSQFTCMHPRSDAVLCLHHVEILQEAGTKKMGKSKKAKKAKTKKAPAVQSEIEEDG